MEQVTLLSSFFAGLLSFASPCVLPLLPAFSAMLAGTANGEKINFRRLYVNALCFFTGFSLVFVLMGATASLLGQWFFDYQEKIRQAGALVIILMGLQLSGVIRIALLEREYRPFLSRPFRGPLGALLLGISFTAGWTPCIGPILTTILLYAGQTATVGEGIALLLAYAMGFALPFFLLVTVLRKYALRVRGLYESLPLLQRTAGYLLILTGILIWLDWVEKGIGILWSFFL